MPTQDKTSDLEYLISKYASSHIIETCARDALIKTSTYRHSVARALSPDGFSFEDAFSIHPDDLRQWTEYLLAIYNLDELLFQLDNEDEYASLIAPKVIPDDFVRGDAEAEREACSALGRALGRAACDAAEADMDHIAGNHTPDGTLYAAVEKLDYLSSPESSVPGLEDSAEVRGQAAEQLSQALATRSSPGQATKLSK